jgi:hypothetical protein
LPNYLAANGEAECKKETKTNTRKKKKPHWKKEKYKSLSLVLPRAV